MCPATCGSLLQDQEGQIRQLRSESLQDQNTPAELGKFKEQAVEEEGLGANFETFAEMDRQWGVKSNLIDYLQRQRHGRRQNTKQDC